MKLLAVTADDLGATLAVNEAIERAAAGGVLTQASLLANGPALDDAVRRLAGRLSLGLHLNLTEGRALTGPIRGVTDAAGHFRGLGAMLRATASGRLDRDRVRVELRAQAERVRAAGVQPAHVDGHHHVHVLPGMLPLALDVAREIGARTVRVPAEPVRLPGGRRATRAFLAWACRDARRRVRAAGLRTSDHFRGLALQTGATASWGRRLAAMLDELPDGLTELMVHPRPGAEGEAEVSALTDATLPERLRRAGIRTISFVRAHDIDPE
jgi:predicted glycoside hydrolase/deacetylase ChbG (UPF0249 family)